MVNFPPLPPAWYWGGDDAVIYCNSCFCSSSVGLRNLVPCINQQHSVIVDMVYKGFEVFDGVLDDRVQ
jgi:hypothetical protein